MRRKATSWFPSAQHKQMTRNKKLCMIAMSCIWVFSALYCAFVVESTERHLSLRCIVQQRTNAGSSDHRSLVPLLTHQESSKSAGEEESGSAIPVDSTLVYCPQSVKTPVQSFKTNFSFIKEAGKGDDTRATSTVSETMSSTSAPGMPRFIWGIASTGSEREYERRNILRKTYLSYKVNDTDRTIICSLKDLIAGSLRQPDQCQLAYAFFVGANNPDASSTELVTWNETYPIVVNPVAPRDAPVEDDVVYLNIRENQFEGKIQTWFAYAAFLNKQHQLHMDYIVKADSDTLLYPKEFLNHTGHILPLPAERVYSGMMNDPHSWETTDGAPLSSKNFCKDRARQGKKCNPYIVGHIEILSADLAEYIGSPQVDRAALTIPDTEDMTIGEFVWSHPEPINFIPIENPLGVLWDHDGVRTKFVGQIWKKWFRHQQSELIETAIAQNLPSFALAEVPSSGADRFFFGLRCVELPKDLAIRCFERFDTQSKVGISQFIVGFVRSLALMQQRQEQPVLDPVISLGQPNMKRSRHPMPRTLADEVHRIQIERSSGLWVLRNPLDRFNSFFYEDMSLSKKKFTSDFRLCFPTMKAWTVAMESVKSLPLETQGEWSASVQCSPDDLTKALEQFEQYLRHLELSREALKDLSADVFVIRYEHMREDYAQLLTSYLKHQGKRLFSANAQLVESINDNAHAVVLKSGVMEIKQNMFRQLSVPAKLTKSACCVLKNEIAVYQQLLLDAVNLDSDAKKMVLGTLASQCGSHNIDEVLSSCFS